MPEDAADPLARAALAEAESSPIRLRGRGIARDSSFTGITYSGAPSSAIMARVGRSIRPPFPKERSGLPEDFDPEEREDEPEDPEEPEWEPEEDPEDPPEEGRSEVSSQARALTGTEMETEDIMVRMDEIAEETAEVIPVVFTFSLGLMVSARAL